MSATDLTAILPLIIVGITAVAAMLMTAFRRNHELTLAITASGLALSILSLAVPAELGPRPITGMLIVDHFTVFYFALVLASALGVAMLSYGYLKKCSGPHEELYILLLLAVFGAMVLIASDNLVSLFLGLEILSVSLYALISYHRDSVVGAEAGVKYLILGAVSSAFLVFGMALIYFETGTLQFSRVASASVGGTVSSTVILGGLALIIVAVGFKLSLVPFHMWVADVFEGSPAPVTAFVATVSKGSIFALILRYFAVLDIHAYRSLLVVFALIAVASMFVGNYLALMQRNVKRMLAYSSVAHMGYLLVAFLASGPMAPVAVTFYLVAYFITSLGAFGTISVLSEGEREASSIESLRGLAWRRPWLGAGLTVMMLSLAGIPLTAGFLGKFYVLAAGVESGLWALVSLLVINSAIGLFYYLRVVSMIYSPASHLTRPAGIEEIGWPSSMAETATLLLLTALVIWFGVNPSPLIHIIQSAVAGLL